VTLESTSAARATAAYTLPFVAYLALMALERATSIPAQIALPIRYAVVTLLLVLVSRPYLSFRPSAPVAAIAVGATVFLLWIGPDVLFGYRQHWLFRNALTGSAASSIPGELRSSVPFVLLRAAASTALVPVFEELFWRGWLMRWLIHQDFQKVPLGQYAPFAFWGCAVLFAAEHGPYWEVGLAAGIVYNWWMVRRRNLADCILAHAITNGLLSAWVLSTGQWAYWY